MTKVALIIGGGSGMGADAARRLRADGFEVGVMSSSGKGEALGQELGGLGMTGSNLVVEDLKAFVDQAMARWGRIDVLVNSAGHGPKGDLLGLEDADWHAGMDVYLMNVVRTARLVTPVMVRKTAAASSISRPLPLLNRIRYSRLLVFFAPGWQPIPSFLPINMHRKMCA